ncbi:molybdopterin synthase sulfur carrier subunit [Cytobacillus eiseniae]|uniref:Molybdopterin synthase sulfur carrier subunit n=1 Tax=Cytobacillus eiseniae TaxID=762947 RepID=A0ABS4RJW4_9BACI|nr:molybdopterin converting factor subunit 1 [Cytobacillus eiseniae]MBP2243204.1 molybdopterin synthase sulfur carrier subunit [Cytobacillus eiseniae]
MNKVLFFAHLKDAVGEEVIELDTNGKSVVEIKELMKEKYPALNLENVMAAINEEFASDEDILQAGDTIAFIPPVSGG